MSFFGAMNMLGLAKRVNARILQASTSEVKERSNYRYTSWVTPFLFEDLR